MKEIRDRYEIFLKVCETGSFSKAAEALNYTQSGISQMMAGFEEELGVQLFARAKKGVTLTDNGRMLMPYIQEMTNQKDKLRQAAFNINHKIEGKLRIGSFSSVTAMWMPEVIHYFNRNYPQVEVQIFDGNYDEIRDWIIHGQVDCGFLSSIVADNLKFYPLCEDPLCAVMQKNHPLAEKKSVRLEELLEYPFIIETPGCDNDILHLLERCGKEPKTSYSFRDDTLIMVTEAGFAPYEYYDDGEIVGVDATGYLNCHFERKIPSNLISIDEARKNISTKAELSSEKLAIIPTEFNTEVLCYEFKGKINEVEFIEYINAQTGKEEDTLIVTNTENGTLTE